MIDSRSKTVEKFVHLIEIVILCLEDTSMNFTRKGHRTNRRHRREYFTFRHTCLLDYVLYVWIVRSHNDLDIKNGETINNHVKEILISTNNYMREIVQRDKPPDKGGVLTSIVSKHGSSNPNRDGYGVHPRGGPRPNQEIVVPADIGE